VRHFLHVIDAGKAGPLPRTRNRFLVTLDPLVGTVDISEAPL